MISLTALVSACGIEPSTDSTKPNADVSDPTADVTDPGADPAPSGPDLAALVTADLVPTSNVANASIVGVPNNAAPFLNVDDGATPDDNVSYVRGMAGIATTSHTVGYSGAPAGTVTSVTVSYRASRGTAVGTAQVVLFNGTQQIGAGAVRTLGASYATFSDSFAGLSVADGNQLRTQIVFHNTATNGALRYTQIGLHVTTSGICVPTTCAALGDNCGTVSDHCSGMLSCGSCSAPNTCGGGGTPNVCGTASTGALKTVFIILMENHNWSSIKGSASAPYINNTLLPMGAHAESYLNVPGIHPSEPNYLWLEAGTNFGITNDNNPSSNHQSTTQHLVTQLQAAGLDWTSYQEGISGTTCPLTATGLYAPKHNPMIYFDDVTNTNSTSSQNCIQHVRPYTELAGDLQANTVASYNFITPNLCDDMHNSSGCATTNSIRNGDTWLSQEVPKILASPAYQDNGVLLITWDESEGGDVPIGMIVLSPKAKPGFSNTIHYDHSSTLRTVQEIMGVTPLLRGAAAATDLSDLFQSFP